jgi:hypothetical protein
VVARSVLCASPPRKAHTIAARVLPDPACARAARCPRARRGGRFDGGEPKSETAMPNASTERDPNAELRSFEPLRVVLALGALLLGLVMSIH